MHNFQSLAQSVATVSSWLADFDTDQANMCIQLSRLLYALQRIDSVTLTHRRLSLASPGHYGGGVPTQKNEIRRATFTLLTPSMLMQRQSIQQMSGARDALCSALPSLGMHSHDVKSACYIRA